MIQHVVDAVPMGITKVDIRTVDADVVALTIASFSNIYHDELWIALGTRSRCRYIPVHQLVAVMHSRQCATIPIFHALTGCDSVYSFRKKTAWEIWKGFPG